MESEAFKSLNGTAIKVLLLFFQKRRLEKIKRNGRQTEYLVTNNGEIIFTYSEAQKLGFSRCQFRDALDVLVERGFISVAVLGGGLNHSCNLYRVHEPDTDQPWKDWIPPPKKKRQHTPAGFKPGHKVYPGRKREK